MMLRAGGVLRAARFGAGAWLALVAGAAGADGPRPARLVAEDALLYAEIARPADLLDQAEGPKVRALFAGSPTYAQALEQPKVKQLRTVVEHVATVLDTTPGEGLRKLLGGGLVLAVEGRDKAERIFLIATPTDPAFLDRAHEKLLKLARQDAAAKGNPDPVKENDYRDVHAFSVSKEEAHAIVDGRLLIANGGDALKALIDRTKDAPARSIEDDAAFSAARKAIDADALAFAFARLERLRQIDPSKFKVTDTPNPLFALLFGGWIEALRSSPWIAAGVSWTDAGLSAQIALPEAKTDVAKRFVPPSGSGAPARLEVPGAVANLSLWRDLGSLWEARAELLPPEAVQGLAQLDTAAGQFFGGRDFGTGVLGALTPDWRVIVARQDPAALDPTPEVRLPAFALVIGLKPDDPEFAVRLKSAFQSFIGLVNLGAAQTKAQPLMLGSENVEGVTIATSKYLPPKGDAAKDEPVPQRYNFSPSAVQVGDHFVISSTLGLARDLVRALQAPAGQDQDATLVLTADGDALAKLVDDNQKRLVMQNMLEKGHDKPTAEREVGDLARLLRFFGRGRLTARDGEVARFRLSFDLGADR